MGELASEEIVRRCTQRARSLNRLSAQTSRSDRQLNSLDVVAVGQSGGQTFQRFAHGAPPVLSSISAAQLTTSISVFGRTRVDWIIRNRRSSRITS